MTEPRAAKIGFDNGGEFIRETRREVERYLADARTRARGRRLLYLKAPIAFGLMAGAWGVLVFAPLSLVAALPFLLALVVGAVLTAFCVQHDANHGAYFGSRRHNHLLGWTTDVLLGISSYAWRVKHNVAHHTYTNVDGYDADATQVPLARLLPSQAARPWYRLQHLYIWPLYSLMALRWQTGGDVAAFVRGRVGHSAVRLPRGWDLAGVVAGKLLFVAWALVIPMLLHPWWVVLLVYVAFTMLLSLVMVVTFQLAHCVEEADSAAPDELVARRRIWAVHEVETTVNFCPGSRVLTWMLGGLNYQIEHHLFPRVPHTHYPHIARILRRTAAKHGVRYASHGSLWNALRSHGRHLRRMGRAGVPVEIEMG